MIWEDEGFIISKNKFRENAVILEVFTSRFGKVSGIVYGGSTPPYVATTEFWNGTSWTELNDMSTARYLVAPAGTSAAALATGGDPGPSTIGTTATEEWTASLSNFTITSS